MKKDSDNEYVLLATRIYENLNKVRSSFYSQGFTGDSESDILSRLMASSNFSDQLNEALVSVSIAKSLSFYLQLSRNCTPPLFILKG